MVALNHPLSRLCRFLPLVATMFVSGLSEGAERVALVIGNNAYQHAGRLENPVRDAVAVGKALGLLGFEVIPLENATVQEFYDGLEKLKQRAVGAKLGLVFFAGHGVEVEGKNYLLPVDAELSGPGTCSPPAWGWPETIDPGATTTGVFPTCVGMDRRRSPRPTPP